ncbi:MAG: 50S ribosomal protein L15 [Candidatus Nealsonbacteria bacterium CG10_big_fil_rev_8_21_14_0_10_36_24]|uniref:Large ribosomal subunit protein uL15 n=1 Tax=Candidatus Nealsonbacteria bacterium CG10_big_fil_rev_8_21_14_0_10_36_24 TaxID=1974710 RepID=A0A2M6NRU3_9BACT|nr:MAG: 50S ribosomal protein L15 [Candidatus Nealsonbacteria bacterium CG10_big_fil_rev_8_21_14_0_10_36_24]
MQLHQLSPKHKLKKKKRIGRGGKRGTYSGKGIKGQKARAGRKFAPVIRELIKRYPKLRGYRVQNQRKEVAVINIGDLDKNFKNSEIVNPKTLLEKKIICKIRGEIPKVKILGKGEIKKALIVEGCDVSKAAKRAIEKSGGVINLKIKNQNAK